MGPMLIIIFFVFIFTIVVLWVSDICFLDNILTRFIWMIIAIGLFLLAVGGAHLHSKIKLYPELDKLRDKDLVDFKKQYDNEKINERYYG